LRGREIARPRPGCVAIAQLINSKSGTRIMWLLARTVANLERETGAGGQHVSTKSNATNSPAISAGHF